MQGKGGDGEDSKGERVFESTVDSLTVMHI